MKYFLLILLSLAVISQAQIQIAGEQDGVFDSATYIVTKDVIVPEGKNLEFLKGSKILFSKYSGMKVYGQFKLKNSLLDASDTAGSWNGIEVNTGGTLCFDDVTVSRSILGIGVPDSSSIKCFKNVTFSSNKSSLRIGDIPVFIRDGQSYTFEKKMKLTSPDNTDTDSEKERDVSLVPERTSIVKPLRWVSCVSTVACAAVSLYCTAQTVSHLKAYDSASDNNEAHFNKTQYIKNRNIAIGTGIGAGISGAVFIITFTIGEH